MDKQLASYAPDFPVENWTEEDRFFLEPFFTNLDGHITLIRNLPPELVGALCSKASRAPGYLLRVFLREYIYPILKGEDKKLAEELVLLVKFLREHGGGNVLNNERARRFYRRWLAEYGDDSIAQLTGTHVIFWGLSQVAIKFVEDQRIGLEPIEKSTRYVSFGEKVNGRYLYYVPRADLDHLGLTEEFMRVMDGLFDAYNALVPRFIEWLKNRHDEKPMVLEKKAFDTLRGLLPMATLGQVAFRGNAQAFEYLLNRTAEHPLGELRWISAALLQEFDKELPSLFLRVKEEKSKNYQLYLAMRRARVKRWIGESSRSPEVGTEPKVRLVEYDPETEIKIIAALLYPHLGYSWESTIQVAKSLGEEGRRRIFAEHFEGRKARWYKVGRAFENAYLRFEIMTNIGAYRDLHRHRMLTQDHQPFTIIHGYDVPPELAEANLEREYRSALESVIPLFGKILEMGGPELAQYVVPLAYRVRFYQLENLREFFWETELRTISQGHPDYRHIEQEKYRLVKEVFPLLAEFMLVDMNEYSFARRDTEARIRAKQSKLQDS